MVTRSTEPVEVDDGSWPRRFWMFSIQTTWSLYAANIISRHSILCS